MKDHLRSILGRKRKEVRDPAGEMTRLACHTQPRTGPDLRLSSLDDDLHALLGEIPEDLGVR